MSEKLLEYFEGDQLASDVWLNKYADKGEETPDDMHVRIAEEFYRIDKKYQEQEDYSLRSKLSRYGQVRTPLTNKIILRMINNFKYIVPQGSIMATLGTNIIASLSNCWVAESPTDSYGGILRFDAHLAYYYKRRGGVGGDISNLRPEGTTTQNTAKTTSGMVSFMPRFSNTTREVAMEGRRGALMLSCSVNHPDIMKFIKVKRDGTSITGANISVRLTDEFMEAVENDEDYILTFPCDARNFFGNVDYYDIPYDTLGNDGVRYYKKIKAKEIYDELVISAKEYAEPGVMYWDNVLNYDPCAVYYQFLPICSNPCGEQFLNANDSCRLMLLNLYSFVKNPFTKYSALDLDLLYKMSYEHARLGDNLVDLELEYIQRIIDKIKSDPESDEIKQQELELWEKSYANTQAGRRIGLGITALADMLAALGLKYDSTEGMAVIKTVMSIKMRAELDCLIDLAILRGAFTGWDNSLEYPIEYGIETPANNFYGILAREFPEQVDRMKIWGRRSVSWSTIAPAGSVSILTKTSSGCEPLFYYWYFRRKKINPSEAGNRIDFTDETGDHWQNYAVLHPKFKIWLNVNYPKLSDKDIELLTEEELLVYAEKSPWFGATANSIDWIKRNEIQAILQKYTTNAISSTINLPSNVTLEEVSAIYMSGWKFGLKGQTVYVDGSRSGVLVTKVDKKLDKFGYVDALKRPKSLPCEIHTTTSKGKKWNVIVGILDGNPYEVFAMEHFTNETHMDLVKIKQGRYDLVKNKETYSEDVTSEMNSEEEIVTRLISTSLRHGADIKFIVEQLNKSHGDMFSFSKAIARVIKKYIPDGSKSTVSCEDCGSSEVIFEEGCNKCRNCGSSKCG